MTQNLKNTKQTLLLYWGFAWHYKFLVIGLGLSVVAAQLVFQFLPVLIMSHILQRLSSGEFTHGDLWGSFGPLLLLYSGCLFLGGILLWRIAIAIVWTLERRVQADIHRKIFAHLMDQSADFHANRFGGSLVSQANKFAGSYVRMSDVFVFQVTTLILSFVFTIIILLPRAPYVTLFLIGFSLLFIAIAIKITKPVRQLNAIHAMAETRQTGALADAITNILAVKSFAKDKQENLRYGEKVTDTNQADRQVMSASLKRDTVFATMTTTLGASALVISLLSAVVFSADVGTVFLVVSYAGIIGQRLWDFSQVTLRNYNRALGDAYEMTEILKIQPEVKDPLTPEKATIHRGGIQFKNVGFAYTTKPSDTLFKKLDLSIKPGEKIGLIGHSGGGKTTITKLLLRFVDIQTGEILIDGQNISHITQNDLRSHIAYVPQEPLLFHRSILENINYGAPGASRKEVEAIAKLAHAHEFIKGLTNGYDTLVGERGVKLSGGQRQRIAIARAMIKNAPVLVLDEATSALDSESEALIQDALWKLMEGRTAIVIAHRLSTIQKMDRIIVLEDGKIIEEGSHKVLLGKNGKYAELWDRQSGGFIES